LEVTGMNSKTNSNIGNLAKDVDRAIKQEKLLNQDLNLCLKKITSNIGSIIEEIKKAKLPS
ncbi:MAG: hypothetical protein RR274_02835, partial [Erysipelotrichaceae bacterium]